MEQSVDFSGLDYNPELEFEGDFVAVAKLAFKQFEKKYKEKYDLRKYVLSFQSYTISGVLVHKASFIPIPVGLPSEGTLDIPSGGVWSNGPGVSFFFDAQSLELLNTTYMR